MKKNITMRLLSAILMMAILMTCVPAGVIMASAAAPEHYDSITADSTALVNIDSAYEAQYFEFVPTVSGRYQFFSSANSGDPRVELLDAYGDTLASDDDSGGNANFSIYYSCEANTTYYIKAYAFSDNTGYYTLNVKTIELYCSHDYVVTSSTPADCTSNGVTVYACSLCNHVYSEATAFLGHDYADGVCTRCGEAEPEADEWDGSVDTSWYNDYEYEFIIDTAEELAGLAYLVNNGNSFTGKTIYLGSNIDLKDIEWTPIGRGTEYGNQRVVVFSGRFDGMFHTISGLYITGTSSSHVGLFGSIDNATIENLAIDNAYISVEQTAYYGCSSGILVGYVNRSTVSNISVSGEVTVNNYNSIACTALAIGYVYSGGTTTVTNVSARGTVYGYCNNSNSYVGGIVGVKDYSEGQLTVNNCIFVGTVTASDRNSQSYAGGIIGISCGGERINHCVFIGEIYSDNTRDAIIDYFRTTNYSNCYYNANFTSTRGTATDLSSFNSLEWIQYNLGWDFNTVWGFANDADYPVLRAFAEGGYVPHIHEYEEASRIDATCMNEGVITYACIECERTYTETLPIISHDYVLQSTTSATCQEDGVEIYACSMCGDIYENIVEYAYGHSYENGYCVTCGERIFADAIVIGPGENAYVEITESYGYVYFLFTPTQSGRYQFYSSNNSGDTYGTLYDGSGNQLTYNDDGGSGNNFSIYYDCEANTTYFIKAHMFGSGTGYYTFYVATIEIYCDHDYTVETTPADCVNDGITTYTCSLCGNVYSEVTEWALGHDYYLQNTTEANCELNGVYVYTCTRCEESYEDVHTYAYGHYFENGYCTTCGEHIFADAIVVTPGDSIYIDTSGYVYFQFTPTQSGQYNFYSTDYSGDPRVWLLDVNGNELAYNDDGGYSWNFSFNYDCYIDQTYYIKAYNYSGYYTFILETIEIYCDHEYAEVSRTDATCTSEGIIYYACTLCDATSSEIIPMLDHDYLVQSTTTATCTSNGVAAYACSACGHSYEEIIERAYGHDFVDEVCTRCGADEPEADLWDGSIDTSWYNNDEYEFIIYTAEELAGLAYLVNYGCTFSGKTVYLGADIDLANLEWTPIGIDSWISGFSQYIPSYTFSGVFDGCNHTIYNLSNSAGYSSFAGLFGTTYYATIRNVELANVNITLTGGSYRAKVGALIGYARSTVVQNCGVFNATLTANATSNPASVGGLIGITITSTVENSFAYADVAGNGHIGGIVGGDYTGSSGTTIRNCYAVGSLTSTNRSNTNAAKCVAGILAYGNSVSISNCVYIGDINNDNNFDFYAIGVGSIYASYYSIPSYGSNFTPDDFMSYDWVVSNLYWDFDEIWEFNDNFDYPVLQGFSEGGYTPHTHEYVETSRIEPTCVNEGVITYTCTSCGRTYNETIVTPGHEFVLQSTTEADCVNNGVHTYNCTRCQESYEEVHTYAYGHSYENGCCVTCGERIFADAIVIGPGENAYVEITESYGYVYFRFTPARSGRYQFYSSDNSGDTYGTLYDGSGNQLTYNDDGGSGNNFSIYYNCEANTTYFIKAHMFGSGTGYYTFYVATIEIYCDHDYVVESSTPADCVTDGITTYACSLCGNVYSEVTEWAFGHDHILQGTTEADCVNNGVHTYSCTRCNDTHEVIHTYAYGHYYENGYCKTCGQHIYADAMIVVPGDSIYVDTVGYVYFQFTPTQSGRYNFYSTDYSGDPRAWLIDEAGNELAYDDDSGYSWNFSIYFDCEANQTYYIKVGNSGSYYTFNVDTVEIYCDHDYVIESSTTADCVNDGTITYVCSLCGNTYVETVELAHGHDYILQSATAADCVNSGMEAFTCSRCNDSYEMVIRPLGHHYENGVCIRCGAEGSGNVLVIMDSEPWNHGSIARMLNSLVSDNKIEYWNSVTTHDVTAEMLRSYGVVYIANAQESTSQSRIKAMKSMLEEYVSNGGILIFGFLTMSSSSEYGNTLPGGVTTHYELASNNYIVDATHPIITGALSDNFVLTNEHMFGSSASHDYIDADTLPEGSRIIVTDTYGRPTLAEYDIGSGTVIATGMTWEFYWHNQSGNFGQYAYDDLILYAVSIANGWTAPDPDNTHTPSGWIVDTEATCTTPGSRHIECIDCGAILTIEEIPVTAHTYGEWSTIVEATCTTAGAKRAYCTLCENAYIESYIPATGHTYSSTLIRAATCTTPGIMAYTCAKCNDSYQVYIYSEHQYVHSTRIEPTCTEDGADVYVCTRCEDSYTVVIAGGHDYVAEIITVATPTTAGEMKYTCSKCGDYYIEEIPARPYAEILLVQDRLPWSENNNVALLDAMMASGYIGGWDITTTAGFGSVDMSRFNVILIANDQTTATYDQLRFLQDSLVEFARAGGVVIYGACDNGWAGGNISYTLPEGVEKNNYYSHHNYIVDASHPIVLGSMTDGKPLTNDLLYGNYCSHTAFNMNTLPDGANIILQDGQGNPTLVEYAVGDGHIILSGLTWEFYYTREAYDYRLNTTYTRNVYDDLIVYAASLSNGCDHAWDDGVVIEPTCTERGYTLHTCALCDRTMKENYTAALGHALGDWEIEIPATAEAEGLKVKRCTLCGETLVTEVLPIINAAVITVESLTNSVIWGDEITFTVVISGADPVKSMALTPIFDTNYFELVSVSWVIQAFVSDIEEDTLRSVAAWRAPVDINTTVYSITLRAKALTDSTTIDFTAILSDEEEGTIIASVVGKTVSIVECSHTEGSYVHMNAEYHAYICDHCGYTEMQAHVYDDEHDTDCNVCGHARYLLGDVNSDGIVDSDDSVYLLYHLFFFEESGEYPVNQVCDFNGDGVTDSDDALYLLYHVLYAYTGDYPLHDAG